MPEEEILQWELRDHLYRTEWGERDPEDVEVCFLTKEQVQVRVTRTSAYIAAVNVLVIFFHVPEQDRQSFVLSIFQAGAKPRSPVPGQVENQYGLMWQINTPRELRGLTRRWLPPGQQHIKANVRHE